MPSDNVLHFYTTVSNAWEHWMHCANSERYVMFNETFECYYFQLADHGSLTAEELAQSLGISVLLAKERLQTAEKHGKACRDESIEGLRFYPNQFLQRGDWYCTNVDTCVNWTIPEGCFNSNSTGMVKPSFKTFLEKLITSNFISGNTV